MRQFTHYLAAVILLFMLASPIPIFAAVITHTVKEGESLTGIAKKYYGSDERFIILAEYNNIPNPKKIEAGLKLTIPKSLRYKIKKGDSLAQISKKYLDNKDRYKALMEINAISDPKAVSIDQIIKIPAKIPYTVKKGETLAIIAEKFYGDIKRYSLIASYNFISDPKTLEPGQKLIIPISDLEIVESKAKKTDEKKIVRAVPEKPVSKNNIEKKEIAKAEAPQKEEGQQFLKKGIDSYFKGKYDEAVAEINTGLEKGLKEKGDKLKAHRFLAYTYVAKEDKEEAKRQFKKALEIDQKMELDPIYVSPKIIEVFKEVKGE
ncbi:MAG: LysM peptidoglycan-binding domain-containing protein [Nitrospirae bacterium]|nr:LysM peptidoglycan-binding domain-containing protein [Nitrospirota bacterium]